MASFTFGSVGDIIAICQILQSTVSALNDARGSAADYQALGRSLANLTQVLLRIDHLVQSKKGVINMAGLDQTLRDCYDCLKGFNTEIDKYSRALGERGQKQIMKDVYRKIKWMNEKEEVTNFYRDISTYLAMLQTLLQLTGFEINAADQSALHTRLSATDTVITTGFSQMHTLLEKIDRASQLRGEGGVSNAAVRATTMPHKLERRTTSLADGFETSQGVTVAFEDAAKTCSKRVTEAVWECQRLNRLFTHLSFDLDQGLESDDRLCLVSLDDTGIELTPGCVRRIRDIFEKPSMFIEYDPGEIVVSVDGYEYLVAVLTVLQTHKLLNRIFVAMDEQVGVYGFTFFRDGEWRHCIVDDRLYLERPEFSVTEAQRYRITSKMPVLSPQEYARMALTGSQALYFAASYDQNETAIPLLEKAYASAHGDYGAIQNMYFGDVLEDFTGGVSHESDLSGMPHRERFWRESLASSMHSFFIFASNRRIQVDAGVTSNNDTALVAAVRTVQTKDEQLLLLRYTRPDGWRWEGAWSDGSEEWTPKRMMELGHKFGDDTLTWISYRDFIQNFRFTTTHRVFGPEWQTAQIWAAFEVPWSQDALRDTFHVTILEECQVVIVLSRLDPSYFRGLEGQYEFELDFTISQNGTQIARAKPRHATKRSNNMTIDLTSGTYIIRPHVIARKLDPSKSVNNTILATSRTRQNKLTKVAQSYDLAHAKVVGWRAVNEAIQQKKQQRLSSRNRTEQAAPIETVDEIADGPPGQSLPPPKLHTDENLGYDDWDAVIALGLRVLVGKGGATIELKRHGNEDVDEGEAWPPLGKTTGDYESDSDDENDTAHIKSFTEQPDSPTFEEC